MKPVNRDIDRLFLLSMIKLFKYEAYNVKVEPEALMLKPFRLIYNRDRTIYKEKAMLELAFIYFYSDPRSDYSYIIDSESRANRIKEDLGLPDKWKPDKLVDEAIEFYESFKPTSVMLLNDTRRAIDKLREGLNNIDINEKDDKGKPVHTLASITSTIKQIPQLIKALDEIERNIAEEMRAISIARGDKDKTILEDGIDLLEEGISL